MPGTVRWSSTVLAIVAVLAVIPARGAWPADADPVAFLATAHAKHADLTTRGLKSFQARVTLRRADDENVARVRELCGFTYSFTAPGQEEFDFANTLDAVRKPIKNSLTGLWRELTGALWFSDFEGAEGLGLTTEGLNETVTGAGKFAGRFRATFESATGRLAEAVLADTATRNWTYAPSAEGLRVRRRTVSANGAVAYTTTYAVDRTVDDFVLPSVITLEADGKRTEFHLAYVDLNGKAAWAAEFDPAIVKAQIDLLEKGWRGLDDGAKVRGIREVAEFESDLASAAIARLALKDASSAVREHAAEVLGVMKRANVVPALVAALGLNEKEIRIYLRLIDTLGRIGDPRAVDVLSKDWWNQRIAEYGTAAAKTKIRALGMIHHASSVDAVLEVFTLAADDKIASLKGDLLDSLKRLTGQDFMLDHRAWSDWWKRNRAGYR